ncbi:DUF1643 domain-containing protein [Lysinibacillus fusiformis]|uniref:DUF1643 domain-containing protein n=1 Tax=Lysinibacillus fusiformis TaxID=28031 RepID=UPI002ECABD77|nr:DUF1643 domain-containing protein [Lysinibacillus fusiformis]
MAIRDEFNCYGYFYNIEKKGEIVGECRNILEIVRKSNSLNEKVDAIAIMMNPGKSTPIGGQSKVINDIKDLGSSENQLVLTNPDETQTRIMGVMNEMQWNRVRVLNLSDLREKDHNKLKKKIEHFEDSLGDIHSIFSKERKDELNNFLIKEKVPLILAWGTERYLLNIAETCLNIIKDKRSVGVSSSQEEKFFLHPLATNLSWKNEILKQLENI